MSSKKICFYFLFVITGILTKSTKDPYDIWLMKFLSFCLHSENTSSTTTECIKSGFWQNLQHDLKEHLLKKKKDYFLTKVHIPAWISLLFWSGHRNRHQGQEAVTSKLFSVLQLQIQREMLLQQNIFNNFYIMVWKENTL